MDVTFVTVERRTAPHELDHISVYVRERLIDNAQMPKTDNLWDETVLNRIHHSPEREVRDASR